MKKYKIPVVVVSLVFFTAAWGAIAAGASFTAEVPPIGEPWGAGRVFLLLGPTHGEVRGLVTLGTGLRGGDYTQVYMAGFPEDPVVSLEGPISIYTFDPDPANPLASYEPVNGDVFHLIVTGPLTSFAYKLPSEDFRGLHPKAQLAFPDLDSLFDLENAPLAEGLSWRPAISPSGGLDLLVVPEPCMAVLLATGCVGLVWIVWRRKAARSG